MGSNIQSVLYSYIQYCRPYNGVTAGKVSRFDNGYLRFGPIYTNLVIRVTVYSVPVAGDPIGISQRCLVLRKLEWDWATIC